MYLNVLIYCKYYAKYVGKIVNIIENEIDLLQYNSEEKNGQTT